MVDTLQGLANQFVIEKASVYGNDVQAFEPPKLRADETTNLPVTPPQELLHEVTPHEACSSGDECDG